MYENLAYITLLVHLIFILFVIFGGALLGTVVLFPIMVISKFLKKSYANREPDRLGWGMEVPFGPFLGLAGLFYFLGLQVFVDDWFEGIISNFTFVKVFFILFCKWFINIVFQSH